MFTSVRVKNYKSLVDLNVDLADKKNVAKPVILIYGENGVGKSNFASIFYTLHETLQTMSVKSTIQEYMDRTDRETLDEDFLKFLSKRLRDTEAIIKDCKTINVSENMLLEFGFVMNGKPGSYMIEYDDTKIVHERLDYAFNKNRTTLFDITMDDIKINDKIFTDNEYKNEFIELLEKYKGKHSFLSIMVYEVEDKADGYVLNRVHPNLYAIIGQFMTMSIRVKSGNRGERGKIGIWHEILGNLESGTIGIDEEEELNNAERMVNEIFTLTYSDIKQAYYKREIVDEKIKYSLFLKKMIYGRIVDVDFELESTGTQHLLSIIPFLMMSVEGETVIIDEIDTGIHDLLVNNILSNVMDSIEGQLIITTHNTMLLESDIEPKYIYTFMVDKDAKKTLAPIVIYEDRAHPNLNYRNRYLKGMYGGVPIGRDIDFDELWDILD